MTRKAPEIIEVTPERMEELLERAASGTLRDEDMELMRQIFASYAGFFQIVGDKNTTIARLRKLLFGATTENSQNVLGDALPMMPRLTPTVTPRTTLTPTRMRIPRNLRPAMVGMVLTTIRVPTRWTCRIRNFLQAMSVPTAARGSFTKSHPAFWFALSVRRRCRQPCTAGRSCAVICAENCSRPRFPPA